MTDDTKKLLKERRTDAGRPKLQRLSSGLPFLDQLLDGGFPVNSLVCLLADPVANADMLLYQFAAARQCHYIATSKRPDDVKRAMEEFGLDHFRVQFHGGGSSRYLLDTTLTKIREAGDAECNIVVDNFSFYLRQSTEMEVARRFMEMLRDAVRALGGLAYLYVYKNTHSKELENLILNGSDVVLDIEATEGEKQETTLSIPKIRGMVPLKRMRIVIGDKISIDTSRDIA